MALKSKETTTGTMSSGGNTNIVESSSQADLQNVTIGQLKSVFKQIENNQKAFDTRITNIGVLRLKMLTIKRFNRIKSKLKRFLTQIRLKLYNKGYKVSMQFNAVAYAGLFLTGRALEWFKPYIIEF